MPLRCPENLDEARAAARTKQVIFAARDGAHVVCSGGISQLDLSALQLAEDRRFIVASNYVRAPWALWSTWCRLRREPFLGVKLLRGHVAEIVLRTPEPMPRDLVERIGALLDVAASGESEC